MIYVCDVLQGIPYADAMNKTLVFAIFDFDRFSKHDQIGEVKVPLCQIDLAQTIEEWRELQSVEGEGGQVSNRKKSCSVRAGALCMIFYSLTTSYSDSITIVIFIYYVHAYCNNNILLLLYTNTSCLYCCVNHDVCRYNITICI